jgi:N-acetyl-gamma-glutamyl-phosphate reductase
VTAPTAPSPVEALRPDPAALPADPLRVAIVGATGYVGAELVRLLERHPAVTIVALVARDRDQVPVGETFAHLGQTAHRVDGRLPDASELDVVFLALPHGQTAAMAPDLLAKGVRVVDLGSDFRLSDPRDYPTWYGFEHPTPELLPGGTGLANGGRDGKRVEAAVYGLPELHRNELRAARLIAAPGCYPTATLLAVAPLARAGLIGDVVVDAKSGVSGAGREPKRDSLYGEINESIRAYGVGGHRHLAEMQQELRALGTGGDAIARLMFTPHLVPMTRGILSVGYVTPTRAVDQAQLDALYDAAYRDEPFVHVSAAPPATKSVMGSNLARVFATVDERSGRIMAMAVIDNLVKGAAGQGIQALNVAAGLPETAGLDQLPLYP